MKITLAFLCFLISFCTYADSTLRASDLEKICTSKSEEDRSICVVIVKAYKDGFIEGVANGAMGVYKNDPEIFGMVKDIKATDFAPRLKSVVSLSTCIQNVQAEDLAKAFSAFVGRNPSLQAGPYRTAMFRTIEANYCKK